MPLYFPGETVPTTKGTVSIRAKDQSGASVVVISALEAIQDHGLPRVKDVASNKYDNRQLEPDGSIFVSKNDF
jgi:hypothetical protein